MLTQENALNLLGDQDWRLRNLYKIKDKQGMIVDFSPNWAQLELKKPHYLNIILKARQLGITTYHAILFLDTCLFNQNINCAIVADSKPIAQEIFIDKVKFAYDNLPQFVRDMCPAYRDNVHEMRFANGSVFRVATSLRGGTLQLLHITEFAKICQDNPSKANEIVSGALNAVQAGQFVCIESTARGREGHFYNLCKEAQSLQDSEIEPGKLDWKLWFFPWWQHPDYVIDSKNVLISKDMEKYFVELESKEIFLKPDQKAWYVKKMQTQGEYMKREYPSTPEEAFESANEGFYFATRVQSGYGNWLVKKFTVSTITKIPMKLWHIMLNGLRVSLTFMKNTFCLMMPQQEKKVPENHSPTLQEIKDSKSILSPDNQTKCSGLNVSEIVCRSSSSTTLNVKKASKPLKTSEKNGTKN